MPIQEKAFTLGNIAARFHSLDYNTTPVQVKNTGTAELTINAGDPVEAEGIATTATGLLGLSIEHRIIKPGETDEIQVLDYNYGFGVILNAGMLPATVTTVIKTALIAKGFKLLP